jgi:hypothetical protein
MGRGHADACDYTPRQLAAFVAYYERERMRELIERVRFARLASVSDEKGAKEVEKQLKAWEKEFDL